MRIVPQSATLEWVTPDAEKVIEAAGRVCYQSKGISTDKFLKSIIQRGHEAVIEHASASFRIITDRGISAEITRHRLASYCQESTRYCNYAQDKFEGQLTFIDPGFDQEKHRTLWLENCQRIEASYLQMIAENVQPQRARAILPLSLKAELIMTANFREWRWFLKLRLAKAAHPGVQEIASKIQNQLVRISPACFDLEGLIENHEAKL
jgi:thymidylate synthase (FAD)